VQSAVEDTKGSSSVSPPRSAFHLLVVDRHDVRREGILDFLTELGFGSVQIASAPDSASSFADAQPPHVAIIGLERAAVEKSLKEAEQTAMKLHAISRETQLILLVEEDDQPASRELLSQARSLAKKLNSHAPIWDVLSLPSIARRSEALLAIELTLDRACRRLYFQFETEHWRTRFSDLEALVRKEMQGPARFQKNHFQRVVEDSVHEFAKVRDLDAVIASATKAFSRIIEGRPVVYLRWLSIRNSFVVQHFQGLTDSKLRGLGFQVAQLNSLKDIGNLASLNEFVRDVFGFSQSTALLHGSPEEPTGLFILLGEAIRPAGHAEFEAVAFLFDLTWGRLQALRDRHALERVDKGTGLPNKKALQESLEYECVRARRLRHPLSAATIDVGEESSKTTANQLEEKLGSAHEAVMKIVGQTLRRALRGTDLVARVDRHRFVVLMPHTSFAESVGVIDRMCRLIERLQLPALEQAGISRLRARSGVAEYPRLSRDADGLLEAMDNALTVVLTGLEMRGAGEAGSAGSAPAGIQTRGIRVLVHEVPPGFVPDFDPVI
jgi:diguanylate cyclase (GGDEF)-like protein